MLTFKTSRPLLVAATALMSFVAVGTANATPYAFAEETFNDFVITLGTGATLEGGGVTVTDSENYPGAINSDTETSLFGSGGNAGAGATAANAFGGPNETYSSGTPGPVTTNTPSPIGESGLKGGDGAQAASSVGGLNVFAAPGDGAYEVAEAGGKLPAGGLGAGAAQTENVFFTVAVGAAGATLDVTAQVQEYLEALTTKTGELATAQGSASLVLTQCAAGSSNGIACPRTRW